jgi:hypothetical protein
MTRGRGIEKRRRNVGGARLGEKLGSSEMAAFNRTSSPNQSSKLRRAMSTRIPIHCRLDGSLQGQRPYFNYSASNPLKRTMIPVVECITANDSYSDAVEAPPRRRDGRGTIAKRHSEYDDSAKAWGLYTDSKSLKEAFDRIEDIEDPSQVPSQ